MRKWGSYSESQSDVNHVCISLQATPSSFLSPRNWFQFWRHISHDQEGDRWWRWSTKYRGLTCCSLRCNWPAGTFCLLISSVADHLARTRRDTTGGWGGRAAAAITGLISLYRCAVIYFDWVRKSVHYIYTTISVNINNTLTDVVSC